MDKEGRFDDLDILSPDSYLEHYGTPRHSGRYPWGSGDNPYQGDANFLSYVHACRDKGLSDTDIYRSMGMNSTQFRQKLSQTSAGYATYLEDMCVKLREKGMGWTAIGRRMGIPESSVRSYVKHHGQDKRTSARQIADQLKASVDEHGYLDVGSGTEQWMEGVTATKLNNALALLKEDGYSVISNVQVKQMGTDHRTKFKVLAKPGTTWQDVQKNIDSVHHLHEDFYSDEQKHILRAKEKPVAVDSKRVAIVYNEEGGIDKDGLIELRRGVKDISLGEAKYAQVRINVDDTHYLKGMAIYADDLPDGVDIRFNTNKHVGTPMKGENKEYSVLKPMKTKKDGTVDWENPFGASIHEYDASDVAKSGDPNLAKNALIRAQRHYIDDDGTEKLSALNIVNEEGAWTGWSKVTPSQFLSKQSPALAKSQLDVQYQISKNQLDDILKYNNPTVRKELLRTFASECDSNATDLHGAPFPGQTTKVLLPFTDVKDNEIYAPNLADGTKVALVRFPHGGIFEIPTLTVNNRAKGPNAAIENALDAVGISKNTADRLSGADFDGDTALVIPIDNVNIKTSSLDNGFSRLKGFDPKEEYRGYPGMEVLKKSNVGAEMGKITNLITDMTVMGAPPEDIAEATRHSMVIIDANKHELDYKRSEVDHHIAELKAKYQGGPRNGAATLLSRSTKEIRGIPSREQKAYSKMTPEEKERYMNGEIIYRDTGYSHTVKKEKKDKDGNVISTEWKRVADTTKSPMMMETNDAYSLVSRASDGSTTRIESIYADYANKQKALANRARAILRSTEDIKRDPAAAKEYSAEVESLLAKLNEAEKNNPLERHAQSLANKRYALWAHDHPNEESEKKKKMRGQMLDDARYRIGAKKKQVIFTPKEWEAINAGAVSATTLIGLLSNSNPQNIRSLAMPHNDRSISPAVISRAKSLLNSHYTQAEVADMLNISVSTLTNAIK